ncbi:unnamed protein product [Chironomus riparius]|uniref:Uncharacterized protein n=1 Tax=Chironomus riparius TaxID=315576 RepID=A0A9N9WL31_9DIPT|nr:unnamed protein product [Chironomus riparius]
MQLKLQESIMELNNSSFIFDEPMKPRLSSRIFVDSAKINLNRYWHKLEQLISDTKIIKKNKKKLRKLKSVNQQLLNNRIHPAVKQEEANVKFNDEIYGFTTDKFPHQQTGMTSSEKSAYKSFSDDRSLYHGVNLNATVPTLMTTSSRLPVNSPYVIDKTSINYNYYLNESQQHNAKSYHNNNNDNALYVQKLNESLRRKGYKFMLAEIDRASLDNMYFKGQYLEEEGYLV